jgi:hypothetical protein
MTPRQHEMHRTLALHLAARALEGTPRPQRQAGYVSGGDLGISLARIAAGVVLGCIGVGLFAWLWFGLVALFGTGG